MWLLLRTPSIGLASLVYSIIIHLSSLRADLLDVADPWWVVTIGLVLLLSPLYHLFVIEITASVLSKQPVSWHALPLDSFAALVVGELIVNAGVILGSVVFLLPGIYVGLRGIYYKQSIILHKTRALLGIQESFLMTRTPRVMLQMLLLLAVAYCIPLAVDFLLTPGTQSVWVHPVAILVSTVFVAWVNVYVTISFQSLVDREEDAECPQRSGYDT